MKKYLKMHDLIVDEEEQKFIPSNLIKNDIWDKEFIIYQWYDDLDSEFKTKCIIDLKTLTSKWVSIKKNRINNSQSKKEVKYLNKDDVKVETFLGKKFVCKRRSIYQNIHLDHFIRSNEKCVYLIENEGAGEELKILLSKYGVIDYTDVTDDISYRNTNMCDYFNETDFLNFQFLLKMFVL